MDWQTKKRYETWKGWKIRRLIATFLLLMVVAVIYFFNHRGTNHEGDKVVIGSTSKSQVFDENSHLLGLSESILLPKSQGMVHFVGSLGFSARVQLINNHRKEHQHGKKL